MTQREKDEQAARRIAPNEQQGFVDGAAYARAELAAEIAGYRSRLNELEKILLDVGRGYRAMKLCGEVPEVHLVAMRSTELADRALAILDAKYQGDGASIDQLNDLRELLESYK